MFNLGVYDRIDECGAVFGIRKNGKKEKTYEVEYVVPMILIIGYLHIGALQGLYLVFTSAKIATTVFAIFLGGLTILGVTAGAHRLWAHRSYEAKLPLRLLLLIMHTTACQSSVLHWSREHRTHHKYRNTNADPYNPQRGFFFAHVGWSLCQKHPDVIEKGAKIDMSDLQDDSLIQFQHEHRTILMFLFGFVLPTIIPVSFWNETFKNAFLVTAALRWTFIFNLTSLINSAAHIHGTTSNTNSVENLSKGEAWYDYHYAVPWDYTISELGGYWCNAALPFIKFFAWIGWAYDLKTVSPDVVNQRILGTGDGSDKVWGWSDQDITKEERQATVVIAKNS